MHRLPRLHEALDYAAEVHRGQPKKGTSAPYLAHLAGVCSLVLEYGGDEEQAMAGLMHDVLEDCGAQHAGPIREKSGARVLEIGEGCTDGLPNSDGNKPPWRERKRAYLKHLLDAPAGHLARLRLRQTLQRPVHRSRSPRRHGSLLPIQGRARRHAMVLRRPSGGVCRAPGQVLADRDRTRRLGGCNDVMTHG